MVIEWIIAGAVAALVGGLAAYFWEDLKTWASDIIYRVFWDVVDILLDATVFILSTVSGYVKLMRGYYQHGGKTYQRVYEEEIPYHELPADIREQVDYYGSVETLQYR